MKFRLEKSDIKFEIITFPDRKLAIYVTHMVNPKGITTLSENYDEVYFTNSYKD